MSNPPTQKNLLELEVQPVTPSPEEIMNARTPRGGWDRRTLASWGIDWPPRAGWKAELERKWREQRGEKLASQISEATSNGIDLELNEWL